jgi:hypothetical protein
MKIGDKVKIIGVNWQKANNYIGKEGEITSRISKDFGVKVQLKHVKRFQRFPASSLEKIEPEKKTEETQFKVGDEVEIIGLSLVGYDNIGEKAVIERDSFTEAEGWTVKLKNGDRYSYKPSSLKLVTPKVEIPTPKFKKGDRVKIGKNEGRCPTGDATVFQDAFAWGKGNYYVDVDGKKGIYTGNSWVANEKYMRPLKENRVDYPETFYCCYVDGTGGFNHKHDTEAEAMKEAERLAKKGQNHGRKVHVLKCIASCEVPETPVQWNFK